MKCLVTGGAGFIGSNLVKFLCDKGHDVVIIDDLSSGRSDIDPRAKFIKGSIGNRRLLDNAINGRDVVFHLAATGIIKISLEKPVEYFDNNVMNGIAILEAMRRHGIKKIIYSSSSGAYGEPKRVPIRENDPKEPINPYGAAKLAFEHVLSAYHHSFGINSVSFRYFNVYGPGDEQYPVTRAVPSWIKAALKKEQLNLYWSGKQKKDFVFVEDVVRANYMAALKCKGFHVYNVGGDTGGIWMNDLAKKIEKIFGHKLKIKTMGARAGDPTYLIGDVSKIKKELGWKPEFNLEEGLKRTIDYYASRLKK